MPSGRHTATPQAEAVAPRPSTGRRNQALDGIRGLAVIAIMLYHGGVPFTGGGFVALDVFFVLSGFLITGLLLDEQRRTGRLDLPAFWIRRGRRLLPALGALLVAVLLVMPALGVSWPAATRGDAVATMLYASNWWFVLRGQSYADQFADPSPLQHTWSLAVEEQWYLLLPLVLVGLLALGVRRRLVGVALVVAAAGTFAWSVHLAATGADAARLWFGTDVRVTSLLLGAALAVALPWLRRRLPAPAAGRVLGAAGAAALLGLLVLVLVLDPAAPWAGVAFPLGLSAVALLAAVVVAGAATRNGLSRALSWRPLALVGLVSYGLYLWHWPLYLSLTPDRTGLDGPALLGVRVAATAALATVSYVLLEQPVRTGRWPGGAVLPRRVLRPALAAGAVLVLAAVALAPRPGPLAPDSLTALAAAADEAAGELGAVQPAAASTAVATADPPAAATADPPAAPATGPVTTATTAPPPVVLLVGDSNTLSLFAAVRDRPAPAAAVRVATRFGCGVVPFTASLAGQPAEPQQPLCGDWARARASEIRNAHADVGVLVAGSWEQYDRWIDGRAVPYTDPRWAAATRAAYTAVLREMKPAVRRTVVVLDHCHGAPETGLPAQTMFQAGRWAPVVNDPARVAAVNAAIRRAAAAVGDVRVVDPNPFLCPNGFTERKDGVLLRTDGMHFTTEGAQLLWTWLGPRLVR